ACGSRLWSALFYLGWCGLLAVLICAGVALRLWGSGAAWRAGIMCASSLLVVLMGHQLTLDMSLTVYRPLMLRAFCLAHDARISDAERRRWMWLAWAGAAGACLTKGL